ncbi:hypothetical protein Tco_1504591 [Tanacetum coccineum]
MSSIRAWDETVNKLKMSLSSWKLKTLSIGGRLTLLKSVLEKDCLVMPGLKVLLRPKDKEVLESPSFYALNRGPSLSGFGLSSLSRDQSLWAQALWRISRSFFIAVLLRRCAKDIALGLIVIGGAWFDPVDSIDLGYLGFNMVQLQSSQIKCGRSVFTELPVEYLVI